jgi:hypothetical protein
MFILKHKLLTVGWALTIALAFGFLACTETAKTTPAASSTSIEIPTVTDWQNAQLAFSHGSPGQWDYYLWGGFANSIIKKGNTYYLYYQGSPSYSDQCDSVSYRKIGVAKSTDGIHWVKSDKNPVLSWTVHGGVEEGPVSSAAWLGADGKVYVYYGANTGSGCTVNASARLAVSADGETFQDLGQVLSGSASNVWGSGDEIFPVGAYSDADRWYLYYIPNGVSLARKLGVAIGASPTNFTQSMGLNNSTIPAWGPVSIVFDGSEAVLITNPGSAQNPIDIYRFNTADPATVTFYDSYALPECRQASVRYEGDKHWMMVCRDAASENYLVRLADLNRTFTDTPTYHPYFEAIEILYANGYTAGCATSPPRFCPDVIMDRAQAAVFMLRGNFGSGYVPVTPTHFFRDSWSGVPWAEGWAESMYLEGLTGGCLTSPLMFCPYDELTNVQAAVFGLRLKYGNLYAPPAATGTLFADLTNVSFWGTAWAEQAYEDGLIPACGTSGGKPLFCPNSLVSRGFGASIIVKAKGLTMP